VGRSSSTPNLTYGVTVSNLVKDKDRVIALNDLPGSVERLAFLVTEGDGSIVDDTFEPTEHEILDVLPNGIHHYAVYDIDGNLLPGGSPDVSPAGQPRACYGSYWTQRGSATTSRRRRTSPTTISRSRPSRSTGSPTRGGRR
jgi:hypothetical protein